MDLNPFVYIEENVARLEMDVRRAAAEYLGAGPDDVAMTDSTTMGLGCVYGGLLLRPGDDILTTTHDHIVTTVALQNGARRHGATVRQVALYDGPEEATADRIVER